MAGRHGIILIHHDQNAALPQHPAGPSCASLLCTDDRMWRLAAHLILHTAAGLQTSAPRPSCLPGRAAHSTIAPSTTSRLSCSSRPPHHTEQAQQCPAGCGSCGCPPAAAHGSITLHVPVDGAHKPRRAHVAHRTAHQREAEAQHGRVAKVEARLEETCTLRKVRGLCGAWSRECSLSCVCVLTGRWQHKPRQVVNTATPCSRHTWLLASTTSMHAAVHTMTSLGTEHTHAAMQEHYGGLLRAPVILVLNTK